MSHCFNPLLPLPARAILPMSALEMEMEVEDTDVEMIDSERNTEYTYQFEAQTDTDPIVFKVDQESLSQQHSNQIKRSKRIRLALFIVILMLALGALGAIVFFIIHFKS